jgi:hypothetical protein
VSGAAKSLAALAVEVAFVEATRARMVFSEESIGVERKGKEAAAAYVSRWYELSDDVRRAEANLCELVKRELAEARAKALDAALPPLDVGASPEAES